MCATALNAVQPRHCSIATRQNTLQSDAIQGVCHTPLRRLNFVIYVYTVSLRGFYFAIQSSNFFIALATGSQVAVKYHANGTKQNMKRLAE